MRMAPKPLKWLPLGPRECWEMRAECEITRSDDRLILFPLHHLLRSYFFCLFLCTRRVNLSHFKERSGEVNIYYEKDLWAAELTSIGTSGMLRNTNRVRNYTSRRAIYRSPRSIIFFALISFASFFVLVNMRERESDVHIYDIHTRVAWHGNMAWIGARRVITHITSGQLKENFTISVESRMRASSKILILQILFLRKERLWRPFFLLSAETILRLTTTHHIT